MLLGRYRMADAATQQWVRETIARHLERYIPELAPPASAAAQPSSLAFWAANSSSVRIPCSFSSPSCLS